MILQSILIENISLQLQNWHLLHFTITYIHGVLTIFCKTM